MEDILRDFYIEFLLQVNGEQLCKKLEDRSLIINMDTVLVRDTSRTVSRAEGNDKLYGIICRKIIFEQLVDLLQCMAASGNCDLAQKIANKHKDVLPQSFHLEDAGIPFDSGPRNVTNIYTNKVEMKGHYNTFNAQLCETGADSQNMESDASTECSDYVLEDETDGPRNVH